MKGTRIVLGKRERRVLDNLITKYGGSLQKRREVYKGTDFRGNYRLTIFNVGEYKWVMTDKYNKDSVMFRVLMLGHYWYKDGELKKL